MTQDMPKNHPFYVDKFLTQKKMEHKKSFGIQVKKQKASPLSLSLLIKCKKMQDSGQLEQVIKSLESMGETRDPNLKKQAVFMLSSCYYKLGQYKKAVDAIAKVCDLPQETDNDIIASSSFSEHQLHYIGGKACDKIKDYKSAVSNYRKGVEIMEKFERVNVDYKPLKLSQVKMRLGFSLILSAKAGEKKSDDFDELIDEGIKILKEVEE